VKGKREDVNRETLLGCPLRISFVCIDAEGGKSNVSCAWWIPGAECCAIVQIARKLNDLAALEKFAMEGIAYG